MKKFFIAAIAAVCALGASAQQAWDTTTPEQQWTVGVRAGLNVATIGGKNTDGIKSKASFHAGLGVEWNAINSFGVNTGAFYTAKGAKNFSADFIEVPVYASYRLNFAEASQLQVNVGPYFDFGVAGDAFKDDSDCKKFQMGLGFGAAYVIKNFLVGLQYQAGLTEVVKDSKWHYNNFAVSVGYNF